MKFQSFRKIIRIILISGFIGFTLYSFINRHYYRKNFFESKFNSKIIRQEGNISAGRSYDFITDAGITITLMNSDTLYVGDSVVKEKNSWKFNLYRKNKTGRYQFTRTLNL